MYQSNDISVVFIALFFIPLIVGGMSFMYDMVVHQNMDEAYKNAKSITQIKNVLNRESPPIREGLLQTNKEYCIILPLQRLLLYL